jgi:preprotein translocase subunit SecG
METQTVILIILASIIIGAIIVSKQKSKAPENKGGDTEPSNGNPRTGDSKAK